ncbi:MAG: hypothetical protein ACRDZR_09580, partial [Acidimicrobiales bacterium]
ELVGGRLRVASRPGGGTTVGAAIPVGPASGVQVLGTAGPPVAAVPPQSPVPDPGAYPLRR